MGIWDRFNAGMDEVEQAVNNRASSGRKTGVMTGQAEAIAQANANAQWEAEMAAYAQANNMVWDASVGRWIKSPWA